MKLELHEVRACGAAAGPTENRSRAPDIPDTTRRPALCTRPATDDAVRRGHPPGHDRRHRCESVQSTAARGTLIHHAPARPIRSLMVAMIEPPFWTLLMAPAGRADRGVTTGRATGVRTVGVSAIARGANRKSPGTRPTRADRSRPSSIDTGKCEQHVGASGQALSA